MIRRAGEMREQVRENMRGGTGAVLFRHCFEPEEFAAKVRLCARLSLPPGASIGPHPHEKEDEIYIITSGQGLLDDGTTKTPVSAGDAVLTGRGQSHAIANAGDADLEFIAVIVCYPE
ncbi:MAG: cupin domain-containing protein [Lentisphaerae bacterium]|nr:cupin domain-containing protein [Lentisphaerota bacterium]